MPVQVAEAEKWLSSPLDVSSKLHEERSAGGSDTATGDHAIFDYFTGLLQSEENLAKVPSLNSTPLEHLADGCLVRYWAMVQDQFDPELYLKCYTAIHSSTGHQLMSSGLFRDLIEPPPGYVVSYDNPSNVTGDRHTFYCVPIPAQTEWAQNMYSQCSPVTKAVLDDKSLEQKPGVKRPLEECDGEGSGGGEEGEMEVTPEGGEGATCGTKRAKEEGSRGQADRGSDRGAANTKPDMNFPLPGETGLPCLVKVYGDGVEELRVTSVVECVGVLSKDPSLAHFDGGEGGEELVGESAEERTAHSPPPSLVPRLHCILVRTLTHCNPLLPRDLPRPLPREVYCSQFEGVARSRDLLLSLLTTALLGDTLAAEYTLLHLLSSVYGRTDMMALGKFSFNLTNCPVSSLPSLPLAPSLHNLLTQLLPQSVLLPLSLSVMNSWKFSPRKDYNLNRLVAGALQLAAGTHLLVNEMALEPGHLSEVGVHNLAALGHVIQQQTVTYDFQFHKTEFECDLPIMVLTEGKKSILKVDCVLPLSPSVCAPFTPTEQQLNEARVYLSLHRILEYKLSAVIQKAVEDDFVEIRKTDQTMTAERFHHLLCLARLVSLSYGCSELSLPHWQHAKQLDSQRLARLHT